MNCERLVNVLLSVEGTPSALKIIEASIHLPAWGRKWIATFAGPEPGQQTWRTTGVTDRKAAMKLARKWEDEARRQRVTNRNRLRKPTVRIYRRGNSVYGLSQRQVAALLGMSERGVREIERRALRKLRLHPKLQDLWNEIATGERRRSSAQESDTMTLTPSEITALRGLAQTPTEMELLRELLAVISNS